MDTEMLKEFEDACNTVLSIKTKPGSLTDYAKAYAQAGLRMCSDEEIYIQILYILSNLQYWRGEKAKKTKIILKGLMKKMKVERRWNDFDRK